MKRNHTFILIAAVVWVLPAASCVGQEVVDVWKYTLSRPAESGPAENWRLSEFDDSSWRKGFGGFGTHETPGSRVGTTWATNHIWLRKEFSLKSIPAKPALLIHHDEDAEVSINGKTIATLKNYTTKYILVPLDQDARSALKVGENLMAVHCRQTVGGQFIDVHLVDADHVPQLPRPQRSTEPFQSELITRWGQAVTADNVWTEYPRPQMKRDAWTNLNGPWEYAITPAEQMRPPNKWDGKILVPFPLESKLSGVGKLLGDDEALWYRRSFSGTPSDSTRTLLNFEAVDYRCAVFVNGKSIPVRGGKDRLEGGIHYHQGGNTPFWLDVSDALRDDGENELLVRVEDDTEAWQLRGKQTLNPRGIWYTQVSGIWQTVWLEQVAAEGIADLKISTDGAAGSIQVRTVPLVPETGGEVEVVVKDNGREIARTRGTGDELQLVIKQAQLWSPDNPHLYDIEVTRLNDEGIAVDKVTSYAGIRTIGKAKDQQGHWRFTLNGKPIFHWGTLDQGWWPDGLLTPPSDEAMRFDVEWLKAAGFNMIRKHIKVEPRRYYYHCDRIGMMVWQDHVSGGEPASWPAWSRLKPEPVDADWPPEQHAQFMLELDRMISNLENHPSIVCWVPLNERWGQHKTIEIGKWTTERDRSRLVNIASGGNFWPVGDVVDAHSYPHPEFPFAHGAGGRFDNYIKVMGEFGGHGYPVQGHLWDKNRRNWGYGGLPRNESEYKQRYVTSLHKLNALRSRGIAGGVYTQTTDVEGEINGLMTYDRKVIKIPAQELAELHRILFKPLPPGESSNRLRSKKTQ
ncbi:MAG: glycoside hydrolase family 2 [Pirellulales bacterium]|nr:glycoside hydrolase family 2 [Pirellulales bacterium]